jgi:hypothetical protein
MAKYQITLGDWSDDGHGKTRVEFVEIPDEFAPEALKANFDKNVEELGFNPITDLFNKYEDWSVPRPYFDSLVKHGFDNYGGESSDHWDGFISDGWGETEENLLYVQEEGEIDILMFFIGHGLDGFTWYTVPNDKLILVGGFDTVLGDPSSYGYGLFGG